MALTDAQLDKIWDIRYRIGYSVRYHRRRERFLDLWDRAIKAIAIVGGAVTVTKLTVPAPEIQLWVAAAITVTSTISLVFALSEKARVHRDLARQYVDLDARMARAFEPTDEQIAAFDSDRTSIAREEPPVLTLLVQDCQNKEAISRGLYDAVHPIGWLRKRLMHYVSFDEELRALPERRQTTS